MQEKGLRQTKRPRQTLPWLLWWLLCPKKCLLGWYLLLPSCLDNFWGLTAEGFEKLSHVQGRGWKVAHLPWSYAAPKPLYSLPFCQQKYWRAPHPYSGETLEKDRNPFSEHSHQEKWGTSISSFPQDFSRQISYCSRGLHIQYQSDLGCAMSTINKTKTM